MSGSVEDHELDALCPHEVSKAAKCVLSLMETAIQLCPPGHGLFRNEEIVGSFSCLIDSLFGQLRLRNKRIG